MHYLMCKNLWIEKNNNLIMKGSKNNIYTNYNCSNHCKFKSVNILISFSNSYFLFIFLTV